MLSARLRVGLIALSLSFTLLALNTAVAVGEKQQACGERTGWCCIEADDYCGVGVGYCCYWEDYDVDAESCGCGT